MKLILLVITISLLLLTSFSSCTPCVCEIDKDQIEYNDSLMNVVSNIDVWENYDIKSTQSIKEEFYRLSIAPSFTCDQRVFTLIKARKKTFLEVKYFNKHENGKLRDSLNREENYSISQNEMEVFEKSISNHCFWTMRCNEPPSLDGVSWMIEAKKEKHDNCTNRNSHIVARKNPENGFEKICEEILKLANTSIEEQEKINAKCWYGDDIYEEIYSGKNRQ